MGDLFEFEQNDLKFLVDVVVRIMIILSKRHEKVGTIHDGFDIIALEYNGVLYEKDKFIQKTFP